MSGYVGGDPYQSPTFGQSLSLRVDGGFTAVSINPSGRDVVLASRTGLYVVDLDDPFSPPRCLQHITPWQVADVQWSPHLSKPCWVVSTSNQRALVWNLARPSSKAIEHELKGHVRAITDINFHPSNCELLATCSIDTFVHVWDMRSPQRPCYSTSDWSAGASQVKWNFKSPYVLASSHADKVLVWDIRKGCSPLHQLGNSNSSVNNIDFHRSHEHEIMTSSNDGTVQFWDYGMDATQPQYKICTEFPVWRGRYLPFGEGCCLMPMIGGANSVYLVNCNWRLELDGERETRLQPVYVFKGHSNIVTDFLWRSRHSFDATVDDREFQLVTWSKDCDLRLWPVSEATYEKIGFNRGKKLDEKFPNFDYSSYQRTPKKVRCADKKYQVIREHFVTGLGLQHSQNFLNHLDWVSGVKLNHSGTQDFFSENKLQNLGEEVSQVGHKFREIVFEKISVSTGELVLTLNGPWADETPDEYVFLRIDIKFPENYPSVGHPPIFKIEENTDIKHEKCEELMSYLMEIAQKCTDSGKYCLEPCLRYLLGENVGLHMLENEIDQNNLLNLDVIDQIGKDFSPISGASDNLNLTETSVSDDDELKDFHTSAGQTTRKLPETAFDSTPVPKSCGAVWTPAGSLLCFFVTEPERKSQYGWMMTNRGMGEGFKTVDEQMYASPSLHKDTIKGTAGRPRRYVDILSASSRNNSELYQSDDSDSNESENSIADDWCDIVKNDITFRTKMPLFNTNFKNPLGAIPIEATRSNDSKSKPMNTIIMRDFKHLIPDKFELAVHYKLMGDAPEALARYNQSVAEKFGADELAHCWQMIANLLLARSTGTAYNFKWDVHELGGRWFIKELIRYFELTNNIQMLAMLACILVDPLNNNTNQPLSSDPKRQNTEYISYQSEHFNTPYAFLHSSQQGDLAESITTTTDLATQQFTMTYINDYASIRSEAYTHGPHAKPLNGFKSRSSSGFPCIEIHNQSNHEIKIELLGDEFTGFPDKKIPTLLDPADEPKLRSYRSQYAELVYYWGLPLHRVQLLKFNINENTEPELLANLYANHSTYYRGVGYQWAKDSSVTLQDCCYCYLKTTRRIIVCGNCQHILHTSCAKEWWQIDEECPTGCGCPCLSMYNIS